MYTLTAGKMIMLPKEKGTWLYLGDVAIFRERGCMEGTWLY